MKPPFPHTYPRFATGLQQAMLATLATALATGCTLSPRHEAPAMALPAAYKEAPGWTPAQPADTADRGPWWQAFDDHTLNALIAQVEVSNQNIAAATAAYAQARALVHEQRAGLFPTLSVNGGATRSGGEGRRNSNSDSIASSSSARTSYQASLGAAWAPDVWGRLQSTVTAGTAGAQASAADLAAARLAAQGELASNYFLLRQTEAQQALVEATITGYVQSLQIAQNRYDAGIAPRTDLLQAQTQLANARADALSLSRQRSQLEHAIAVLTGQSPSAFSVAAALAPASVPDVPAELPSELLQRRPDIAAAERRVAAANEQIGIQRSAYFPSLSLSASRGFSSSRSSELFNASSSLWSLGLSAAQTLFNAGLTRARVEGAQAAHEEAVARYRQTVLQAFQQVEDQLAAVRLLAEQQQEREAASRSANQAEQQVMNRYRAGQVGYAEVIAAQATALNARRALAQIHGDRQLAAVALIQALGGGWSGRESLTPR